MTWLIRVPATSANLGPGFDCLGLALDLWNEVEVSTRGDHLSISIEGEGERHLPLNSKNAVVQAMRTYADRRHQSLPEGIHIHCRNRIPLGSGLGSSAAAAISGILAAEALLGLPGDLQGRLNLATSIEGHPDNVAPCLMGGLTASMMEEDKVIVRSLPIADLSFVVATPKFVLPTRQARAALPKTIPHKDAVFNVSRGILAAEALANGDLDLLTACMEDRLHQPYRLPLIPGAEEAVKAGRNAGAAAVVLSGAGPSLLAVLPTNADREKVSSALQKAFLEHGLESRVFMPKITSVGATTTLI